MAVSNIDTSYQLTIKLGSLELSSFCDLADARLSYLARASKNLVRQSELLSRKWDLLPWCKDRPTQIALNWLLRQDNVISIPKATNPNHIRENRAALDLNLTKENIEEIDRIFPPPKSKQTLAMR